ncbi:MAG: hypothetical protein WBX25_02400 [Rhodomicrobium sp.]
MALWLAVSFLFWLAYRVFRRRDGSKQLRLTGGAITLIDEGAALFSALRARASASASAEGSYFKGASEDAIKGDVRALLNRIEAKSPYFDRVNAARKRIQKTFQQLDFAPLSEILQIRRDFWAASEIFLIEDIQALGPELSEPESLSKFLAEAEALLFKDETTLAEAPGNQDPVELRLTLALEEAIAFQDRVKQQIEEEQEKGRFPSAGEIIAVPLGLIKGAAITLREARYLIGDVAVTAQSLARTMRLKGLKGAAEELRRFGEDMPGRFATAFERAGGAARHGGQNLKRHYEFVLEAQELRTRYAELLSRAPHLSEKGKQFLARLEFERRAEQFRETSNSVLNRARQALVVTIAYTIAGLQYIQAKVTPAEHKQLVLRPAQAAEQPLQGEAAAPREPPLRIMLLPASAYPSTNSGAGINGAKGRKRNAASARPTSRSGPEDVIIADAPPPAQRGRLRDLLQGGNTAGAAETAASTKPKNTRQDKPRYTYKDGLEKTSFKELLAETSTEQGEGAEEDNPRAREKTAKRQTGRVPASSLLARLSSLKSEEEVISEVPAAAKSDADTSKGWRLPGWGKRK